MFGGPKGLKLYAPRRFIEKYFPICPFCKTTDPRWETRFELQGFTGTYHFLCQNCSGMFSIHETDIDYSGEIAIQMPFPAIKKKVKCRIESVGTSGSNIQPGAQVPLEEMQTLPAAAVDS